MGFSFLCLNSKLTLLSLSVRRSGAIAETFNWDVAFDTSFEKVSLRSSHALQSCIADVSFPQIEALRTRMLEFLEVERRDFIPSIDITVKGESFRVFIDVSRL